MHPQPAQNRASLVQLLSDYRSGSEDAAGKLVEMLYPELRRMAAARMRAEKPGHTWQPTALVNELYLELRKVKGLNATSDEADLRAFMGLAAHMMKRLLIHHSRPLYRRAEKVSETNLPSPARPGADDILEIEDLLDKLAGINPKLRTVVELRVFEGLTVPEIADRMDCAKSTVDRYWAFARRWLADRIA